MILEGHWYAVKGESYQTNDVSAANFLNQLYGVAVHIDRVHDDHVTAHTVNGQYLIIKAPFFDYLYELKNDENEWRGDKKNDSNDEEARKLLDIIYPLLKSWYPDLEYSAPREVVEFIRGCEKLLERASK